MVDLSAPDCPAIEEAAARIAGHVRRTPLFAADPHRLDLPYTPARLLFKLECLQVTGSFKARGAINMVAGLDPAARARGLVTASGGNHGLGVTYAARSFGCPAAIYLPESTPMAKRDALAAAGAEVVVTGAVWDDANEAALARAASDAMTYVHPFADPDVIAGQGTVGLEMFEDDPAIDVTIVAIGGGGLIAGVATAAKGFNPDGLVIGVEPEGAPTLHDSLAAGKLVTLANIATRAGSLAPRRSAELNFAIIRRLVERVTLVSDAAMARAQTILAREFGLAVELSAAAGLAAILEGQVPEVAGRAVAIVVCAAGAGG